ncbi:hypothetical protein Tco_1573685, partial [Tanacetum coccineum]
MVLPFLCSDDSEADGESEPAEQRPVSSSHDTLAPLLEFPLTPVIAPPGIRRRPATLIRPGEAIPFGRPYRTHPNEPHSSSSSAPSDHSLSGHTPPDTTDADSSAPQRFVHRSLARTPRHRSSSERSLDSSSHSSRPSCKRCRFPTTSVPLATHVSRLIAPTPADLLPTRISEGIVAYPEDGVGMGFEIAASDVREDDEEFEVEASAADTREIDFTTFEIAASDVREDDEEFEVEASAVDTREIGVDPLVIGDSFESSRKGIPDLEDTIYDKVHYMSKVYINRITEIETTRR